MIDHVKKLQGQHHWEVFADCKQKGIKKLRYHFWFSHLSLFLQSVIFNLKLSEMWNKEIFFLSVFLPDNLNQSKTTVPAISPLTSTLHTFLGTPCSQTSQSLRVETLGSIQTVINLSIPLSLARLLTWFFWGRQEVRENFLDLPFIFETYLKTLWQPWLFSA